MSDNINVTPGSGAVIAADDVGPGVLYQRVKVSVGGDGSATDITSGAGAVAAGTPRVTLASDDPAVAKLNGGLPAALATGGGLKVTVQDTSGAALDYTIPALIEGGLAHDAPVGSGKPVVGAGRAANTNPTAVSADGDVVRDMRDLKGRTVVSPHHVREMLFDGALTITASTAAQTLLSAVASTFLDLLSVTLVNTSATGTVVQLLDDDGTTVRWSGYCPPTDMRGIVFQVPLTMPTVNKAWKAKTTTSVSSVVISVQYVKNT